MNEGDHNTYKTRSIILSWENDFHTHVEEMKKWKEALVSNAHTNHYEKRPQALLDPGIGVTTPGTYSSPPLIMNTKKS